MSYFGVCCIKQAHAVPRPSATRPLLIKLLFVGLVAAVMACAPDFLVPDSDWVVIQVGDHDPIFKRKTGLLIKPRELSALVKFDSSCVYDVRQVDEGAYNKVFGLGFVGSANQRLGQPPHQVDGVRVAWRWNPRQNQIDLGAYAYVSGQRVIQDLGSMRINEERRLTIRVDYDAKTYTVMNGPPIPFTHKKTLAYKNGLYFGGRMPAPQKIRVMVKFRG
jgi:hypothetical protein